MSRRLHILSLVVLLVVSASCRFHTAGAPYDGGGSDAAPEWDAADVDPDGGPLADAAAPDAASPVDAAIEHCGQVGGICTANPDVICPPGTRPYGEDEPLDCGGHCCVPDPASTCNSNPTTNCSMTTECTGCWAPATDTALMCFGGRPCCEWTCGG